MKVVKTMTTTDVLGRMKKILKNEHTSYCNWASRQPPQISMDPDGSPGWGQASVFVSHAWRYSFETVCEVIEAYAKEITRRANAAHHPGCVSVKGKNNKKIFKPYFWFDIFTVNQFEAATYPQDFWTTTFKEQVRDIGHTLLILHPWDRPIPLTRAWCVWEMYCTLDTRAEMHIRQPLRDAEQLERALAKNPKETMELVARIDAAKAEAWKESDREMIHAAVKGSVGFDALNAMVQKRLVEFMQFNLDTSDTLFFEAGQGLEEKVMRVDTFSPVEALGDEAGKASSPPLYTAPPGFHGPQMVSQAGSPHDKVGVVGAPPGGESDPHLGPEQVSGSYMQVSPASDFTAEELDDIYDDIGDVSIAASGVAKASRAWRSQAL